MISEGPIFQSASLPPNVLPTTKPAPITRRLSVTSFGEKPDSFSIGAKAHPLEAMLDLQVCEPHLHFFARIARSLELRRSLQ